METLNLKLEAFNGNELIIREGKAPDHVDPVRLVADGDIRTVSSFIAGRKELVTLQGIDPNYAIVIVNKDNNTIQLETNPNDKFGSVVKGVLSISDELKVFDINGGKTFSQKELIKILKFNRIHFADPLQQQNMLNAYKAFSFKTRSEGHSSGSDRGDKSQAFDKSVETNLPSIFTLKIPIYKGERSMTFNVDLCLDVTDAGAKFWFESVELHELQQIEKEMIFERELKTSKGLVVIYK